MSDRMKKVDPLEPEIDYDHRTASTYRPRPRPPRQQHQQQHQHHQNEHSLPPRPTMNPMHQRPPPPPPRVFQSHPVGYDMRGPPPPQMFHGPPGNFPMQGGPTPPQMNAGMPPGMMPPFGMGMQPPPLQPPPFGMPPQGPPLPPGPPPEHKAWKEFIGPNGIPYYYNSVTKKSVWERPAEYEPPPPPPGPPPPSALRAAPGTAPGTAPGIAPGIAPGAGANPLVTGMQEPQNSEAADSGKEKAVALKKLPNTAWVIVLTSLDNEYYLNLQTREATWEMPDDIGELIGQILAGPGDMEDDDEQDVPDQDDAEGNDLDNLPEGDPSSVSAGVKRKADDIDETSRDSELKKAKAAPPAELTLEQKKKEFEALLRETDVNPFSTWEKELPKFAHDPRYTLLPNIKDRKYTFENFCKIRGIEVREEKKLKSKDAKGTFMQLLEENTDQRSMWEDFAKKFRKDSRFLGITDERDRKALFKEHVNGIKQRDIEKRRLEKKKIEDGFVALLKETKGVTAKSLWRDVRRQIENDPRFLAVKSMIEREDFFREYIKKLAVEEEAKTEEERLALEKKAKEMSSIQQREEAVRRQMKQLNREAHGKKSQLRHEESVTLFKTMLIDIVRSHDVKFKEVFSDLERDPRWMQCQLSEEEKDRMFFEHTRALFERRLASFHALIDERTTMITPFSDIEELVTLDTRATRLDRSLGELEKLYTEYQKNREVKARAELEAMLRENAFVKFHVKNAVQKVNVEAVEAGKEEAETGAEWKVINLEEIKQVLEKDKRYNDFDCFATERDRIVFTHVKALIDMYRAEKGGTRDSIVARNAGAFNEVKQKEWDRGKK
ncbi:transcription elongation regulator [Blyttiomyces sp. JEL0837]|nr:transcription elongation regulator [Blyttiomyces sp. JEL0837]